MWNVAPVFTSVMQISYLSWKSHCFSLIYIQMGGYFAYWFAQTAETFQGGARDIFWSTGSTLTGIYQYCNLFNVHYNSHLSQNYKRSSCMHTYALDPYKVVLSSCTHPIQRDRHMKSALSLRKIFNAASMIKLYLRSTDLLFLMFFSCFIRTANHVQLFHSGRPI